MQQTLIKIESKNTEKHRFKKKIEDLLTTTEGSRNKIISLHNKGNDSKEKIENKKSEIQQLSDSFKVTFFQKILEFLSFGSVNYYKLHLQEIANMQQEISRLEANMHSLKKHTQEENSLVLNYNAQVESYTKKIKHIENEIRILEKEFRQKLFEFQKELLSFQNALVSLASERYINEYTREEEEQKLNTIIKNRKQFLEHQDIKHTLTELFKFLKASKKWVANKNRLFVKQEQIDEKHFFNTIESKPLTQRQQDAVLINENNNLVLAGAGSGKTSVIVAKVSYLIKKNILDPKEILILAFNKNAQLELEERFDEKNLKIQIKTFHSFGLSIIGESLGEKPDICPMTESSNNMSKFIKDTIRELMASMGSFFEHFVDFVAYFSIPYKSEFEFNSLGEYYDYQKNYDMKTLKHKVETKGEEQGEYLTTLREETVKSHQELMIANFLTLNGILYIYEAPYKHNTASQTKRQYKPDFYLPEYDIYIEHFGIDRNGNTAPFIDKKTYLEGIKWKVALHHEHQTTLVQTFSYEFSEGLLLDNFKNKLLKHNVVFRELSLEEASDLLNTTDQNNRFVKLFTTFLNHYKANLHSMSKLKEKAKDNKRTSLFLTLFEMIFNEYVKYQKRNHCIDFDDMIVEALDAVKKDKYTHKFKHIFIPT